MVPFDWMLPLLAACNVTGGLCSINSPACSLSTVCIEIQLPVTYPVSRSASALQGPLVIGCISLISLILPPYQTVSHKYTTLNGDSNSPQTGLAQIGTASEQDVEDSVVNRVRYTQVAVKTAIFQMACCDNHFAVKLTIY